MSIELHGTCYTIAEAAEYLGYAAQSTFSQACIDGIIPAHKLGNTWIVEENILRELLKKTYKHQGNRWVARK